MVETYEQLDKPTNQNSLNVPKVVKQANEKRYHKTLGTSVINNPMSPPSLGLNSYLAPNLERFLMLNPGLKHQRLKTIVSLLDFKNPFPVSLFSSLIMKT